MKQSLLLFLILLAFSLYSPVSVNAQGVSINSSGNTADPSAMIDVSSTTKGALVPRMTTVERNAISSPAFGLLIFNTTTACFNMWTGASWKQLCGECDFSNPAASNNGPLCAGQTLNLIATTVSGATYQWTGPNGFLSTQQNPSIANVTTAATGPYSVTATLNGCTSSPQTTIATVYAVPATAVASNNGPLCQGQTLNLNATTVSGASYSWTGPNTFTANTQNPVIANVQTADAGTYSVIASANGCNSTPSTTSVVVNTAPSTPGTITGSTSVCANSANNVYSISAVSGAASYNWTVPSGASITLNSGTSITVTFGSSPAGNITVSATNSCGTSGLSSLTISQASASGTGGTITSSGGYTIHTFTSTETFTLSCSRNVEVLVVAGGGGGGCCSGNKGWYGGGGAGGLIYNASFAVAPGSYPVTVGNGGAAGFDGSNSIFSSLTAIGGGAGGLYGAVGNNGGSGGGGGGDIAAPGGLGTSGQGNNGGAGYDPAPEGGGGGGGAGAVGQSGGSYGAGAGGAGLQY